MLPSSGPRDQDAARCPPPGTSPGPVGEEGCVRLSSGRPRLPGRVPAPPRARASPVESNDGVCRSDVRARGDRAPGP